MNHKILRERYSEFRWKMKAAKTPEARAAIKQSMSEFLKAVAENFGQDVVTILVSKKGMYGAAENVQPSYSGE